VIVIMDTARVVVIAEYGSIMLFGAVRGLASEVERMMTALDGYDPDVIAVAVSRQELDGLMSSLDGVDEDHMTNYDEIYSRHLTVFGDVGMPPPDLIAVCRFAVEREIPIRSVDLSEISMYHASIRFIKPIETVRYGMLMRNLIGKRFKAETAADFALEWDGHVRKIKGFRKLEDFREDQMARRLHWLVSNYDRVFATLEVQRLEGVAKGLERLTRASRS